MKKIIFLSYLILLLLPQTALAHNIGGTGFLSGISHPLLGLDHLLAMIAVGVISTQFESKTMWKVPATFILFMVIGGFIAISGFALAGVEIGIALSVLILGMIVAFSKKFKIKWMLGFVALFAIFHGHAHGAEMPLIANAALYAFGFVASTTILHISGVLIGHFAKKTATTSKLLRFAGAGVGLIGLFLTINL